MSHLTQDIGLGAGNKYVTIGVQRRHHKVGAIGSDVQCGVTIFVTSF